MGRLREAASLNARRLFRQARRLSGVPRAEPGFLVIGAQKSGTSSMFSYLIQHQQILRPIFKEPYYFDRHYNHGSNWYGANFPALAKVQALNAERGMQHLTFEATATYIFDYEAPKRITADLKTRKFIALLRDPVDRAISQYQHSVRMGREGRSMEDALTADLAWYQNQSAYELGAGPKPDGPEPRPFVRRGIYSLPVRHWKSCCPDGSFLILQSENFFADPANTMAQVCRFLGLSEPTAVTYAPQNVGGYRQKETKIRRVLQDFYRPHNEELTRLCGTDFTW